MYAKVFFCGINETRFGGQEGDSGAFIVTGSLNVFYQVYIMYCHEIKKIHKQMKQIDK